MKRHFTMDDFLMENEWEDCNSLRYGFDDTYDFPDFRDEDTSEDREE